MVKWALLEKHTFCRCVVFARQHQFTVTSFLMYLAGGWARWGMRRDGQHKAAHEEFHFAAFQLNLPASLGQARAPRHASGWPSVLNISDTLMAEADRDVCLVSVRKRIVFKLSLSLSSALLQSALPLRQLQVWLLCSTWGVIGQMQLH